MTKRFADDNRRLGYFANDIQVICPNCEKNACIISENKTRLICKHCGKNEEKRLPYPYHLFETEKLVLKIKCCGELLWFFNKDHMHYIREFVEAELRTQPTASTASLIATLPKWIQKGDNRKEILKAMDKLEKYDCN